jgi:putative ubiquitin-RnfH superfamily antitoxin RatB of RatAB toxin-antitoxin module
MGNKVIAIEIVYALPQQQFVISEYVAEGTSVAAALNASRIHALVDDLKVSDRNVGIFGKVVKLSQVLKSGDRIEIYRPLQNDPKEARRRKAAENAS